MRVIMLNDMPWAASVASESEQSDKALRRLGEAECKRRGWLIPSSKEPAFGRRVVYVNVRAVTDITPPQEPKPCTSPNS